MSYFDDNEDWLMGWQHLDEFVMLAGDPEADKEAWVAQQRGRPEDDFDVVVFTATLCHGNDDVWVGLHGTMDEAREWAGALCREKHVGGTVLDAAFTARSEDGMAVQHGTGYHWLTIEAMS